LEGKSVKITDSNFSELSQLCEEFALENMAENLRQFTSSITPRAIEDTML
jgi:hypothetical protein